MKLLTYPDPFLDTKGVPVGEFSGPLRDTAGLMVRDLYLFGGVGLASIQVGVPTSMFVIDVSKKKDKPRVIVNPKILDSSTEREPFEEGCLSVPGIRQDVIRPSEITLWWQDLDGNEFTRDFEGLEARVIQHEMDHLNGILFVRRLSRVKKMLIRKALKDLEHRA